MEGQSSKWVELSKGQNHEVEAANIWYAPNRPYINRHLRSGLNASNYNLRRLPYIWLLLFQKLLVSTYVRNSTKIKPFIRIQCSNYKHTFQKYMF